MEPDSESVPASLSPQNMPQLSEPQGQYVDLDLLDGEWAYRPEDELEDMGLNQGTFITFHAFSSYSNIRS